jgi:hypothetical protein
MHILSLDDFWRHDTPKWVQVIVGPVDPANPDTPPREGMIGDRIFQPYDEGIAPGEEYPSPMPTQYTRLHTQSYDSWDVVTAPHLGIREMCVREVVVCNPHQRYPSGSDGAYFVRGRVARLVRAGLSPEQATAVAERELAMGDRGGYLPPGDTPQFYSAIAYYFSGKFQ